MKHTPIPPPRKIGSLLTALAEKETALTTLTDKHDGLLRENLFLLNRISHLEACIEQHGLHTQFMAQGAGIDKITRDLTVFAQRCDSDTE